MVSRIAALAMCAGVFVVALPFAGSADQTELDSYNQARPIFWSKVYPEIQSGRPYSDLYCGFDFRRQSDVEMQIEHVFPANWFATALGCGTRQHCQATNPRFNRIEADMHNMWPAYKDANRLRSNHSYTEFSNEKNAVEGCDIEIENTALTTTPTHKLVEPRPIARGNIARSIFYMMTEYNLTIEPRLLSILKRWNRSDPVSPDERRRNDIIEGIQGTRNPYIDNPSSANGLPEQ